MDLPAKPSPPKTSMNGGQTRPLKGPSYDALDQLAKGPVPRQTFNAGVVDRLLRDDLIEILPLPSPYASHQGATCPHVRITEAGLTARAARPATLPAGRPPGAPWRKRS